MYGRSTAQTAIVVTGALLAGCVACSGLGALAWLALDQLGLTWPAAASVPIPTQLAPASVSDLGADGVAAAFARAYFRVDSTNPDAWRAGLKSFTNEVGAAGVDDAYQALWPDLKAAGIQNVGDEAQVSVEVAPLGGGLFRPVDGFSEWRVIRATVTLTGSARWPVGSSPYTLNLYLYRIAKEQPEWAVDNLLTDEQARLLIDVGPGPLD